MKKLLATILALVLALGLCSVSWADGCTHDDNCTVHMVKIGDTHYDTMAAAVAAVHEKTGEDRMAGTTIVLLHNATGSGFGVGYNTIVNNATNGNNPVNITIDLNGKTYTMCAPTVGSSGTETNGFQFLKGSTVVIKNGNIVLPDGVRCAYLFQNYANLTLQDVNVDIEKCEPCEAAIHSMNGVVKIVGSTSIAASGNYKWNESDAGVRKSVALLDWGKSYTDGTQVTVETTGTLTGVVQSTRYQDVPTNKSKLTIKSGNFDGEFMREDENSPEILIESGSFTDKDVMEFTSKTEENTTPVASNNGTYYVGAETIQNAANSLPGGQQLKIEQGKVSINNVAYGQGSTYTAPSTGGYYYYPSTPGITAELNGSNKSATDYPGGDYGLVFRSTAAFSTFQGVQVDGKTLAKSNYTAEEGSTVVYLKAAYLKTLAAGKHTVTILSTSGNTSMDFTVGGKSSSPQTFDAGVGVYAVTAVLSVTGMAWTAKKRH